MEHLTPEDLSVNNVSPLEMPGSIIVGAGLAGLATAVKLKEACPEEEVMIIEKSQPQSNSQIAGQRYRAGITGRRQNSAEEISELLAMRNQGIVTPRMKQFAGLAETELHYWQSQEGFVDFEDRSDWFGPRWGKPNAANAGRGRSVINWFKEKALRTGVRFCEAEVEELVLEGDVAIGLAATDRDENRYMVEAGRYILANGSISGKLYQSTNRSINGSAHELALKAGLDLVDSTAHMIHPFGNANAAGSPKIGCYETDELAGAYVYLDGLSERPIFDPMTTELLKTHQSHYHFPSIAERFQRFGSVVALVFANGEQKYAQVAYHSGLLGVDTSDGVSVKNATNVYVVGEAAGLGHWTNHKERYPGFGLLKCLTDAALLASTVQVDGSQAAFVKSIALPKSAGNQLRARQKIRDAEIRAINTAHLLEWLRETNNTPKKRENIASGWLEQLQVFEPSQDSLLGLASMAVAKAHYAAANRLLPPLKINLQMAQ